MPEVDRLDIPVRVAAGDSIKVLHDFAEAWHEATVSMAAAEKASKAADTQIGRSVAALREAGRVGDASFAQRASERLSSMAGALGAVTGAAGVAAAAAIHVGQAWASSAAQGEQQRRALGALGDSWALVQRATAGTITVTDAFNARQTLTQSGLRVSGRELATLTRYAREHGDQTRTAAERVQRFMEALREGEQGGLRQYGIAVSSGATRAMTFESAIRQATRATRDAEPATRTLAEDTQRASDAMGEAGTSFAALAGHVLGLQGILSDVADGMQRVTREVRDLIQAEQDLPEIQRANAARSAASRAYSEGFVALARQARAAGVDASALGDIRNLTPEQQQALAARFRALATATAAGQTGDVDLGRERSASATAGIFGPSRRMTDAERAAAAAAADAAAADRAAIDRGGARTASAADRAAAEAARRRLASTASSGLSGMRDELDAAAAAAGARGGGLEAQNRAQLRVGVQRLLADVAEARRETEAAARPAQQPRDSAQSAPLQTSLVTKESLGGMVGAGRALAVARLLAQTGSTRYMESDEELRRKAIAEAMGLDIGEVDRRLISDPSLLTGQARMRTDAAGRFGIAATRENADLLGSLVESEAGKRSVSGAMDDRDAEGRYAAERSMDGKRSREGQRVQELEQQRSALEGVTETLNRYGETWRHNRDLAVGALEDMTSAFGSHIEAVVLGRESLGEALRGMLSDFMSAAAKRASVSAAEEFAAAIASIFTNPAAVATHTAAGFAYLGVAAAAGGLSQAVAPSAPAAGSGGGGAAPPQSAALPAPRDTERGEGQTIVVQIGAPVYAMGATNAEAGRNLGRIMREAVTQGGFQLPAGAIAGGSR
jgi:hypothetical protein